MLYILRTGIVEQLSETGQRLLLEKCAILPSRLLTTQPSAAAEAPTAWSMGCHTPGKLK